MDRLPSERQESLRKMSSERLREKFMCAGVEEEKAMALDRTKLMEALGLVIAKEQLEEATRAPFPRDETGSVTSDGRLEALRMNELEAEEKRAEREERRAEREERKAEREMELKRMELEQAKISV